MALGGPAFRESTRRSTHALAGTFGSAAAAGCTAAFDAQRMRWLLDYASQQAGGYAVWGRDTDHIEKGFVFGGMPARNGVTAALLVRAGWNGVDDVFSGDDNFFQVNAPGGNRALLVDGLGQRFEVANTDIKKWTRRHADPGAARRDREPAEAPALHQRRGEGGGRAAGAVGGRGGGQPRHARHLPAAHDGGDAPGRHGVVRGRARQAAHAGSRRARAAEEGALRARRHAGEAAAGASGDRRGHAGGRHAAERPRRGRPRHAAQSDDARGDRGQGARPDRPRASERRAPPRSSTRCSRSTRCADVRTLRPLLQRPV